jgi:hypothetical protein
MISIVNKQEEKQEQALEVPPASIEHDNIPPIKQYDEPVSNIQFQ